MSSDTLRKIENFLGGKGINLSVPLDKDQERFLVLQNWRPDRREGRLRSRAGHGAALHEYPDSIHTIWLHDGSDRYVGAGTALYRGTTSILTGLDGDKLFLASGDRFVWIMNRNAQKRDNGSSVSDWGVAAPTTAPTAALGAAGNLTGLVIYSVSFVDADGFESSAGPFSNAVTAASEQVDLTSIPTGPAGTTKRHIYRSGGGLETGAAYRVATINDNSTTIYTDNMTDDEAIRNGLRAAFDRDPPVAMRGVTHYYGRMVGWSSALYPNAIFWSGVNGYYYFPADNMLEVGDYNEPIHACAEINGCLYIFKERSVWRLVGSPEEGRLERVSGEVGVAGPKSIAIGRDYIPYLSRKGVFAFDGNRPEKGSALLDPIFNGEGVPTGVGSALQAINLQYLSESVLELSDRFLYVSFPGSVSTTPSQTAILNLDTGEFVQDDRGFTAMHQEGPGGQFSVAIGTKLFSMDNGADDEGVDINVAAQWPFLDLGYADNDKQIFEVRIQHQLNTEVLTFRYFIDKDIATVITPSVATFNANGERVFVLNGEEGIFAHTFSPFIEGDVDTEVELTKVLIVFQLHPRRTRQYVSAVLDQGNAEMWEARAALVDIDFNTTDANLKVLSDGAAGGDMTATSYPLAHAPGNPKRRAFPVTFPALKVGRLWQNAIDSTADIRVYGTKLEMRRVPVYLDGAMGQFYEQEPISLGA